MPECHGKEGARQSTAAAACRRIISSRQLDRPVQRREPVSIAWLLESGVPKGLVHEALATV
jgi:hypothetical protein